MWYKEKYRIVAENPYNKEKLNGLGLVIYSEWKDSFVNIIRADRLFSESKIKEIEDGMKRRDCFLLTILLLTTVNLKISTLCNIGQFYYLCDFDRRALL